MKRTPPFEIGPELLALRTPITEYGHPGMMRFAMILER